MTYETLLALAGFAFGSSVTPGPNNLMLLASGANFGLRRSVPHMLGISLGHGFMVLCAGLGMAGLLAAAPRLALGLKIAAGLYMLWLAWKIARSGPIGEGRARGRPFTFLQAAAFQWVNPKALAMALSAVSYYGDGTRRGAALVAGTFILCNLPAITLWAGLGTRIARLLRDPRHMRLFNWAMAALLVATMAVVLR